MIPAWAAELIEFAIAELPKVVSEFEAGQEGAVLAELAKRFEAQRSGTITDRSAEIASDRAAVDARLAEREAEAAGTPPATDAAT